MNTFILRRQKNTKLDGNPIIDLPEKEVKLVKLEFSKEERDIYKTIEARNRAIFNSYLREGTVLKYVISVDLSMFSFRLHLIVETTTTYWCCSFACARFARTHH
jgi:SNF2 family DNA or RNA helicase